MSCSRRRRATRRCGPATSSARAPSAAAASSSTATAGGCSAATSSSSRSRASACCGTPSRDRSRRRPRGGARARGRRASHAVVTSRTLGEHVVLKPENLQRGGAFKFRGAYNKISSLPAGTPVLAYSSGNHAQAVALAAQLLGAHGDDPDAGGRAAVEARRDARLRRGGRHYDRYTRGPRRDRRRRSPPSAALELVRPYDDPLIMAGAGHRGPRAARGRGRRRHARRPGRRRRADRRLARRSRRSSAWGASSASSRRRATTGSSRFAAGDDRRDRRAAHDRRRPADERARAS